MALINSSTKQYVETAQSKIIMLEELGATLEEICGKTGAALKDIDSLTRQNKSDINAVTENTVALIELKDIMVNWRNNSQDAELDALRRVTEKLEHSITQSFSTMEQTVQLNARELAASFERFSGVCKSLSALPALPEDEQMLVTTLQNLNKNLSEAAKQTGSQTNSEV